MANNTFKVWLYVLVGAIVAAVALLLVSGVRSALANRDVQVIGPLVIIVHITMFASPIIGGLLASRIGQPPGSNHLVPVGVALGAVVSVVCFAFAKHLVWEYIAG